MEGEGEGSVGIGIARPRLPNVTRAIVEELKLTDYLLSPEHQRGRHKAAFFAGFGFTRDNRQAMRAAVIAHAHHYDAILGESPPFGSSYEVIGPLATPDGRNPVVLVVWFYKQGEDFPRLVTAYPSEADDP